MWSSPTVPKVVTAQVLFGLRTTRRISGELLLPPQPESPEDVPVQKLSQVSPRVSAAYASKTSRTLLRDVAFLVNLGLIERTEKGYRAKKERILAFLPLGVGEPKQQD